MSFEQRVEEWAALCELGVKYDVPVLCHDQFIWNLRKGDWTLTELLARVSADNPKAKIMQTHGCVEDEWTPGSRRHPGHVHGGGRAAQRVDGDRGLVREAVRGGLRSGGHRRPAHVGP